MTIAQQKRQDTQNILNSYIAGSKFVAGQFYQTGNPLWLEKSQWMNQRIQELKAELEAATPEM
jgi:hypothetical protein